LDLWNANKISISTSAGKEMANRGYLDLKVLRKVCRTREKGTVESEK
jgi:hypothetical protein